MGDNLTEQQAAILDYLKAKGIGEISVRPETQLEIECARETMTPKPLYDSFSGTPDQLEAYYTLRNRRYAEMITA